VNAPRTRREPAAPGPAASSESGGRRIDNAFAFQRTLSYGGLAVSLALAETLGQRDPLHVWLSLGVSVAAALWMRLVRVTYPVPPGGRAKGVVYYAVLLAFIVLLGLLSPYFGFFGWTGYIQAAVLPRWLRPPAVAVTAATLALCQVGGTGNLHGPVIGVYLVLALVNMAIAGIGTYQGITEDTRSRQRARMIDELAEANRRLRETMQENSGLHAQLVAQAREAGILDERQRMAGEIHDTIAQGLTGIVTQLEAADRFDAEPQRRARHIALARRLARESLAEARRSVQALRPGPLDAAPHLPAAIADLADQWTQVSGIPVRVETTGEPVALPPALEVVLFRTAQEGLANIAKHAGANRVGLTLSYTHEVVVLDVLDDGAGFDPAAHDRTQPREDGHGFGLTAMRRRLRQVGGSLAIESAPGDGTALCASVPATACPPTTAPPGPVPEAAHDRADPTVDRPHATTTYGPADRTTDGPHAPAADEAVAAGPVAAGHIADGSPRDHPAGGGHDHAAGAGHGPAVSGASGGPAAGVGRAGSVRAPIMDNGM
jgi:signal transduction histidine kinase